MNKKPDKSPFFLESLFPGLHKARPDVAAAEAEAFLRYAHKPVGFDLSKPSVRRKCLGQKPFDDFAIRPVPPEIAREIAKLPDGWQEKPECSALGDAINVAIEKHFKIRHPFYVSLNDEGVPWVRKKGW